MVIKSAMTADVLKQLTNTCFWSKRNKRWLSIDFHCRLKWKTRLALFKFDLLKTFGPKMIWCKFSQSMFFNFNKITIGPRCYFSNLKPIHIAILCLYYFVLYMNLQINKFQVTCEDFDLFFCNYCSISQLFKK